MMRLRPRGADDLGLRRALSDRLLPFLVGAMVFLAALAGAGRVAATALSTHWQGGAGPAVTIQVPDPDGAAPSGKRADAVSALLGPAARRLSAMEVAGLLQPWLGDDVAQLASALPAVFVLNGVLPVGARERLALAAPGTLVDHDAAWQARLEALAVSLQGCVDLALGVVACVAAAVVAVTTRAGLGARRDAIGIVHGLGATDGMIAGRFSARITWLAGAGGALGAALAVPVLLRLALLAAPFQPAMQVGSGRGWLANLLASLPPQTWAWLAALPPTAACIGWLTAQATVRGWLSRLP
jgi:cell division transport system permease protein